MIEKKHHFSCVFAKIFGNEFTIIVVNVEDKMWSFFFFWIKQDFIKHDPIGLQKEYT